jgi:biopolymer transport protein ExbB/TolQ
MIDPLVATSLAVRIENVIFAISRILLYPVLIAAIACLVWVLVELGYLCFEIYLRARYRDLEALEIRTLKAREAFDNGQPRRAYRYLQENNYSTLVARFLFELIRNYQTQRLPEKPMKLLREYEFTTLRRLERTRILVRVGPMLGLMGTLIPLSPALTALAAGDTALMAHDLKIAFSVTVVGLLIGGLAFLISVVRDRIYAQDISDMEYMLELLEGNGAPPLRAGRPRRRKSAARTEDEPETKEAAGEGGEAPAQPDAVPADAPAAAPPVAAGPFATSPAFAGFEAAAGDEQTTLIVPPTPLVEPGAPAGE